MKAKRAEYTHAKRNGAPAFRYDFMIDRKRYRAKGFRTAREAELAENKIRDKLLKGTTLIRPFTFASLVEGFLQYRELHQAGTTFQRDKRRLPLLAEEFGKMRMDQIFAPDLNKFISWRSKSGTKPSTINQDINLLSTMFEYAISENVCTENPTRKIKRLKVTPVEKTILTEDMFNRFVQEAKTTETGQELVTWILFRAFTGCRPMESFYVEWKDLDLEKSLMHFRPKEKCPLKTGKPKDVPIVPVLREHLLLWREQYLKLTKDISVRHDWVFVHPRHPERQAHGFRKAFVRARDQAGIPAAFLTSHTLRHYFVTKAIEDGLEPLAIAAMTGHSGTRMIANVYNHTRPSFLAEQMKKLKGTAPQLQPIQTPSDTSAPQNPPSTSATATKVA